MSDESARPVTSETIEVLLNRVSVRQYSTEPVTEQACNAVLEAAFRAPTSSNIQSYSVVVVRDPETKRAIAEAVGNQKHVEQCPVFFAFCADLTRIDHAMTERGHSLDNNNLEAGLVSSIDASLVGMAAYLAADSIGLKGVMIGGARNNPQRMAELLGLPHRVYCVYGLCLGYPEESPLQKPRMDFSTVVHQEKYDSNADEIAAYDQALGEHYRSQGKPTNEASWSQDVSTKFAARPRDTLRETLKSMGFDFA
jgi:FMN reductase (NADPH)